MTLISTLVMVLSCSLIIALPTMMFGDHHENWQQLLAENHENGCPRGRPTTMSFSASSVSSLSSFHHRTKIWDWPPRELSWTWASPQELPWTWDFPPIELSVRSKTLPCLTSLVSFYQQQCRSLLVLCQICLLPTTMSFSASSVSSLSSFHHRTKIWDWPPRELSWTWAFPQELPWTWDFPPIELTSHR